MNKSTSKTSNANIATRPLSNQNGIARFWQRWVMKPANWWLPMILLLVVVGGGSMTYVGYRTHVDAPPMANYVTLAGESVFTNADIVAGQVNFLKYGLMDYGTMFGDGAGRGPDFTADALHRISVAMEAFYFSRSAGQQDMDFLPEAIRARVQREIKTNTYSPDDNHVTLTAAQEYAYQTLVEHYNGFLRHKVSPYQPQLKLASDDELRELASFFYWGAWVSGAERPGHNYSYTHNWPYDPIAGNTPSRNVLLWSVLATLGLIFGLGIVLFLHGRYARLVGWQTKPCDPTQISINTINGYAPTAMQRATYKYFLVAALLFVVQVGAGILTIHNFIGLESLFGIDVSAIISLISSRAWHLQLALLWITTCWIGVSFFLLSASSKGRDPAGQVGLVNLLFIIIVVMTIGDLYGLLLPLSSLGEYWNLLGNQGWEFVEMGKLWQWMLLGVFVLWSLILFRGIYPLWQRKNAWDLPNWLFYCVTAVSLLFLSAFVATPETNFVIADFWRWAVIHMWAEAFFEVFATIVVAYMMVIMGFISHTAASRVVYIATLLFLGSGLLGISHNFYWNAKPVVTLAIGSIFSTLQVVPLILLTLEAWKFSKLPGTSQKIAGLQDEAFPQKVAFYFLLSVNFWNFFGAGVFGFMINLPIVNYYEHGTYLTVNHGHAAFMGVYGNLSLAAMMFVGRYLLDSKSWNEKLLLRVFWSVNIGLMLMVLVDLLPVGVHQLIATMDHGLWFSRSEDYINGDVFQWLTWARLSGGIIFVLGGVIPLAWFMLTRFPRLKKTVENRGQISMALRERSEPVG